MMNPVRITLYRWAGVWGPFRIKVPCGECALTQGRVRAVGKIIFSPGDVPSGAAGSTWGRPPGAAGVPAPAQITATEASMIIAVKYADGTTDRVQTMLLDRLIRSGAITRFRRTSGWVVIGQDPIRRQGQKTDVARERRFDLATGFFR